MLFLRELKKCLFSISFLFTIAAMLFLLNSQGLLSFSADETIAKPAPGESYGLYEPGKEDPDIIMPAALSSLYREFLENEYTAYPIGFYKNVKLSEKKQEKMAEILSALTGTTITAAKASENASSPDLRVSLREGISYEEFQKHMAAANRLIGGGSYYSDAFLVSHFGRASMTYEEALNQYDLSERIDRFTGGYARLFCDYILAGGLSFLPVLLAVVMCLKDKRAKMEELVHSCAVSSFQLIFTRYFAVLFSIMMPVILLSYVSNSSIWKLYPGKNLDYLAPLKYDFGWILPSVMIAAAVGMFFTELTGSFFAILIQGLWWFLDINSGPKGLYGGYSLITLSPRHNSCKYTDLFLRGLPTLIANRILFAVAALLLTAAAAVLYEKKRRGIFYGTANIKSLLSGSKNRRRKPAA